MRNDDRQDLLLLDRTGTVLRLLAVAAPGDFYPTWAIDGDEVAFTAGYTPVTDAASRTYPSLGPTVWVDAVDIRGRVRPLWHYHSDETCGSGFGGIEPALLDYQDEAGQSGLEPRLQWSLRQHVAIYADSFCNPQFLRTDTTTGETRPFPLADM